MAKPTATELIAKIRELATERPNNKYVPEMDDASCSYATGHCTDGSVGCIFGQAFAALGHPISGVETIDDICRIYGVEATDAELRWMTDAQFMQDAGHAWGKIPTRADELK